MPRRWAALALCAGAALLLAATPAQASWSASFGGAGHAKAASLPSGSQPTANVAGRSVTVSWPQASFAGGGAVAAYVVKRYSDTGVAQTIGSACSGNVSGLSCVEGAVAAGTWRYTVSPKHGNWVGAESAQSAAVTVAPASLSISSSTTVTSLPATLSGSIASFAGGQTVTFRLDDASTGQSLTGSISPSTVPSGGSATVSVTVPAGTSNGAHTIYAVGSGGDVASAAITVSVPVSSTIATSAWDLRDASSGTEADATSQTAAADGRTFATGLFDASFGTKYIEFDLNDPLPTGQSVSGATFNFRFAAAAAGEQACIYLELRRASTGVTQSTHGSTSSPLGCVTGTTLQTVTATLSQLTTSAFADDARIRVYARESAAKAVTVDLATLTGTSSSTAFTLHAVRYADGTAATPALNRWGLATSGDSFAYTSPSNWQSGFATTRYLKHTFPAYVPSGATVTSATLKNYYRATASGHNVCWYFELYAGSTLIATRGSTSAPVSCNSTTSYTTDSVSLTEVNTPARANSLSVRAYYSISGNGTRTTQHDLVSLAVTYEQ